MNICYSNGKATVEYVLNGETKTISFPYSNGDVFAQAVTAIKAVEPEAEFENLPVLDLSKVGKLSKAQRISQLEQDYSKARFELSKYYVEAFLNGDVGTQKEIKAELDNLKAQFDGSLISLASEVE